MPVTSPLEPRVPALESIVSLMRVAMNADDAFGYVVQNNQLVLAVTHRADLPAQLQRGQALPGRVWESGEALVSHEYWAKAIGGVAAPVMRAGTLCAVIGVTYLEKSPEAQQLSDLMRFVPIAALAFETLELSSAVQTQGAQHLETVQHLERSAQRLELFELALTNAVEAVAISEIGEVDGKESARIVFANQGFVRIMGYAPDEIIGQNPSILHGADTDAKTLRILRSNINRGEPGSIEVVEYRRDGTPIWVELAVVPILNSEGRTTHRVSWRRDITERKRAALLESDRNHVLELMVSGAPLSVTLPALSSLLSNQYPEAKPLLFLRRQDTLSLAHANHIASEHRNDLSELALEFGNGSAAFAVWQGVPVVSEDVQSDPVWARLARLGAKLGVRSAWASPIQHGDSEAPIGALELHFPERRRALPADLERLSAIAQLADVVIERTMLAERLEEQSKRDSLTGLANRFALETHLEESIAEARKRGSKLAVLQVDLDGFRQFNDTLGHAVGDELLLAVTQRWKPLLPSKDLLARMGGDEFGLIVHHLESELEAQTLAKGLLSAMHRPFELRGLELFLGASVGIALYPDDGGDAPTLMRHADTAMNVVKRHGKNAVERFRPQMNIAAKERLELEVALRRALDRGELEVYYQPQVNSNGQVVSLEALTYWNHPKSGVISPARFIPIAEESGLIIPLGAWVLEHSCTQLARWRREGLNVSLAVNVNVQQFLRADFADTVARVLQATNFDPRYLELELTESALMHDLDLAVQRLMALRQLGVKVSIDDFGTGYSSLSYLQRLPVNAVKIDRSFVSHLEPNASGWSLVQLIVMMARHLRLGVVAEGVETQAQFDVLRDMAVDRAQGYLFAKPTPADVLLPRLRGGYVQQAQA